jgi:hypothetical protein
MKYVVQLDKKIKNCRAKSTAVFTDGAGGERRQRKAKPPQVTGRQRLAWA